MLASANAGPDDNASQFFFTLAPTPELQNKHTIFGKVSGQTVFNMIRLEEGEIEDERPAYPHKILSTEVLHNPFPDIVPRLAETQDDKLEKTKVKQPGVKYALFHLYVLYLTSYKHILIILTVKNA